MPIAQREIGLQGDIEAWAKRQSDQPSRSEAIRRLIGIRAGFQSQKTKHRQQVTDKGPSQVLSDVSGREARRIDLLLVSVKASGLCRSGDLRNEALGALGLFQLWTIVDLTALAAYI
jgi:hypothetical protein